MPYRIAKRGAQFCVVKETDGSTVACHATRAEALAQMRALYAREPGAAKETMMDDVLIHFGGAVKALGDGKVGGHLVLFSNPETPDLTADYFDAKTDYGKHATTPVLYNHGRDPVLGKRVLGEATLKKDDVGIWVEAQLDARDEYERMVLQLAEAGKLGWSSGTAAHLVEREPAGKAQHIIRWPLGLDASLTPTPAEPRTLAVSLKSLSELPDIEIKAMPMGSREAGWDADAAVGRLRKWASSDGSGEKEKMEWGKYGRAFLWHDTGNAKEFSSYKLPFCDVQEGKLVMMPRAVMAAAGGHGVNAAGIPDEAKASIRKRISAMYARMREEFGDEGMHPAWEQDAKEEGAAAKALQLREIDEVVNNAVRRMVTGKDPDRDSDVAWVHTWVYPGFVVFRRNDLHVHYRRSYSLLDGKVLLGDEETVVEQEWLPAKELVKSLGLPVGLAFDEHTEAVLAAVEEWHTRIAGIRALREEKVGRTLSAANRQRLSEMCEQIERAAGAMRRMLDETMPPDARGQKALASLRLEFMRDEARYVGILAGR